MQSSHPQRHTKHQCIKMPVGKTNPPHPPIQSPLFRHVYLKYSSESCYRQSVPLQHTAAKLKLIAHHAPDAITLPAAATSLNLVALALLHALAVIAAPAVELG